MMILDMRRYESIHEMIMFCFRFFDRWDENTFKDGSSFKSSLLVRFQLSQDPKSPCKNIYYCIKMKQEENEVRGGMRDGNERRDMKVRGWRRG